MLKQVNPSNTKAWKNLAQDKANFEGKHLRNLFINDPLRFKEFSIKQGDLLLDFSKNLVDKTTLKHLKELFEECDVFEGVQKMFAGEAINETENRAVLHTALRLPADGEVMVEGVNVVPEIHRVLNNMKTFAQEIHTGTWLGFNGKKIKHIVNIGIGGSDLGPAMVYEALKPYHIDDIKCHFVSNVDPAHIEETLKGLPADETLFIIASKTFTTQETMANAHFARQWLLKNGATDEDVAKHFVAVSTNLEGAQSFGIAQQNIFGFWDWVGGRYSLWSAIGLSLILGLGFDNYRELLDGAHAMDEDFRNKEFYENIPILLAAISIWYVNFWNAETEAIIPYNQNMSRFAAYFQQGNMESNGKYITRKGDKVDYATGPVIWGEPGTNGQHAFFQLMHQGTRFIPVDFIGFAQSDYDDNMHSLLMSNFFAQTEALMKGKTIEEVTAELQASGMDTTKIEKLAPHKVFEGNKPTNTILAKKLTPFTLGQLTAMYEHKIFVQGLVWNIYSFDQWGVELGKVLAKNLLPLVKDASNEGYEHDNSTLGLIKNFHNYRN